MTPQMGVSLFPSEGTYMSEWHLMSILIGFVIGFVSGLIYALRLYKQIEAHNDRDWAKRHGMPETRR
jgi:hypothetical protein